MQVGVLVLVWALAAIWLYSPERLQAFKHSSAWYVALVRGLWRGTDAGLTYLKLMDTTALASLVEFDAVAFVGCDLNMQDDRLYLVTRWRSSLKNAELSARLTFVADGEILGADRWPLDTERHDSAVPSAFFVRNKGQIWLTAENTISGKAVVPAASLLPTIGERVRICR